MVLFALLFTRGTITYNRLIATVKILNLFLFGTKIGESHSEALEQQLATFCSKNPRQKGRKFKGTLMQMAVLRCVSVIGESETQPTVPEPAFFSY